MLYVKEAWGINHEESLNLVITLYDLQDILILSGAVCGMFLDKTGDGLMDV